MRLKPYPLKFILACCALLCAASAFAQQSDLEESQRDDPFTSYRCEQFSMGYGFGVDYGLVGTNLNYFFSRYMGIFGGFGFLGDGLGGNVGARLRAPNLFGSPYVAASLLGCYGTNALIRKEDKFFTDVQKFSGLSFGVGLDFKFDKRSLNYWTLLLVYPCESDKFKDAVKRSDLEKNSTPIVVSIGYKFGFSDLK